MAMSRHQNRRDTSVARAVTQFALSGLLVVVLLGLVGTYVLQGRGRAEAIRNARDQTELAGEAVIAPNLEPGIERGDPVALRRLDEIVHARLLGQRIVRVKLWDAAGRIVYSDEPRLIGRRFPLEGAERTAFVNGRVHAALSDLSAPENLYERNAGKLLEVYLPIRSLDGTKLLYEQYLRYSSIAANGRQIWVAFLPALLGALILLELVQVPLAWSLARRLRERQREREALLAQAIEASNTERRRIAADLHDGPVQDLAGLSFELAAAADRIGGNGADAAGLLRGAATATRQSVRKLRSLLVEIHPPNLQTAGLEAAIADLLALAGERGIDTSIDIPADLHVTPEAEALLFRTVQETLRNVLAHADATSVAVEISEVDRTASLVVRDDGRGFDARDIELRRDDGHLGLALLSELAESAGGRVVVESKPGAGTYVRLEVPAG
jgi:two-component system NarL family sensor kinase